MQKSMLCGTGDESPKGKFGKIKLGKVERSGWKGEIVGKHHGDAMTTLSRASKYTT